MRALVDVAPESVKMQERPRPMLGAGEEEIRVEMSGICGSDMSGFLGHSPRRKPPLTLGHELVGRLRDGRRVVANPLMSCGKMHPVPFWRTESLRMLGLLGFDGTEGSFAEYVAVPGSQLYGVPDDLRVGARRNDGTTRKCCASFPHWRPTTILPPGNCGRWNDGRVGCSGRATDRCEGYAGFTPSPTPLSAPGP